MIEITVWLSAVGLGLMALPREVAAAVMVPGNPAERIARVAGSVDAGAESQGWWMNLKLASPGVVNLGAMSVIWQDKTNVLGVKLGVLNSSVPMNCDGRVHVLLQMDSQIGDYAAKISRLGMSSTSACRE